MIIYITIRVTSYMYARNVWSWIFAEISNCLSKIGYDQSSHLASPEYQCSMRVAHGITLLTIWDPNKMIDILQIDKAFSWRKVFAFGWNFTRRHIVTKIWVNIGSGNGFVSGGTKPLPEPLLTYHRYSPLVAISRNVLTVHWQEANIVDYKILRR